MDVKKLARKYKGWKIWKVDATTRLVKVFLKPKSAFSNQEWKDQALHA
jgi:hypothetical protein